MQLHPNAQAVQDALDAAGATDAKGQPCRVQILPDAVHTAPAAAAALGVEVGQIANSLIFAAGDHPLLILTSGAHRVDTDKIAKELQKELKRAKPDFVKLHTGQVIGGVSPLGHPKPVQAAGRHGPRPVRRDLGGRRGAAGCLPDHLRRTGPHHRRYADRRGLSPCRSPR